MDFINLFHAFSFSRETKKQVLIFSLACAFSQAFLLFMYAAGFRIGSYFISNGDMLPDQLYRFEKKNTRICIVNKTEM